MATSRAKHLRKADFRTDAWKRMRLEVENQLAAARERLESFENDANSTAQLRGKIATLKNLLALEKAPAADPRLLETAREDDDEDEPASIGGF